MKHYDRKEAEGKGPGCHVCGAYVSRNSAIKDETFMAETYVGIGRGSLWLEKSMINRDSNMIKDYVMKVLGVAGRDNMHSVVRFNTQEPDNWRSYDRCMPAHVFLSTYMPLPQNLPADIEAKEAAELERDLCKGAMLPGIN